MTKEMSKARNKANGELADLTRKMPRLGDALGTVSEILKKYFGDEAANVIDGIYCGSEGRNSSEIPGLDRMLVLTWYYGKLEVAYIS